MEAICTLYEESGMVCKEESSLEDQSPQVFGDETLEAGDIEEVETLEESFLKDQSSQVYGDETLAAREIEEAETLEESSLKDQSPQVFGDETLEAQEIEEAETEKKEENDTDAEAESFIKINQLRSASMIQVPITLEGREMKAVGDTAAQVTLISDKVYKNLDWKGPILKKVTLQTAGRQLEIEGAITGPLLLNLGKQSYKEEVCVAPIVDEMLLGLDFLKKNNIIIDLSDGNEEIIQCLPNGPAKDLVVSEVLVSHRTVIPLNYVQLAE